MKIKEHKCPPEKGKIGPRTMYLSNLIRKRFNEVSNELGLFSGQQDILFNVVENEGLTLSELSKKLGVSSATASVSVKRMEKSGFIEKKNDKKDTRVIRLYPTDKAKEAPEKIRQQMDILEETLTASMSDEEIGFLSDLLDKAVKNMKARSDTDD